MTSTRGFQLLALRNLLATCFEHELTTEEPFDLGHALRTYPVRYDECLNTVLHMELGKFNRSGSAPMRKHGATGPFAYE